MCDDAGMSAPLLTWYATETEWGTLRVACVRDSVVRVIPPQPVDAGPLPAAVPVCRAAAPVRTLCDRIGRYLAGEAITIAHAPEVRGWLTDAGVTGFRHQASMALLAVPRGVTLSYGELAQLAGRPGAARAAGSACARNPLPLVIPCHRVLHAGARRGDVGQYGAATGTEYKRRLLELEDAAVVRPVGTS